MQPYGISENQKQGSKNADRYSQLASASGRAFSCSPRKDRPKRCLLHDYVGRSSSSVRVVVETSAPCISRSTALLRCRASAVRREYGERPTVGRPRSSAGSSRQSPGDGWAADARTRFPAPIGPESATVPADYGVGPDNPDRTKNGRKEPIQPDQQQALGICQLQSLGQLANEDVELLGGETRFSPSSRARDLSRKLSA
jgi:hypothetical protein